MDFASLGELFPTEGASPVIEAAKADTGVTGTVDPLKALEVKPEVKVDVAPDQLKTETPAERQEMAKAIESKAEPALSPLAAKIKADREARQAKLTDTTDYKKLWEEATAKANQQELDPVSDPVGWVKAMKMNPEEQALFARTLLYDLVPDEADANTRIKMFEAKQARAQRMEKEQEAQRQAQAQADAYNQAMTQYRDDLESAVASFQSGSYPESEDYYGENDQLYLGALMITARKLADTATQARQQADLSPANVARTLEAEITRQLKARDDRRAGRTKTPATEIKQVARTEPQTVETMSTAGLGGAGMPRPTATNEIERKRRAAEAAFGGRI